MPIRSPEKGPLGRPRRRNEASGMMRLGTTITLFLTAVRGSFWAAITAGLIRAPAIVILVFLGSAASSLAADALVRLEADPESPWIGQKVVLKLDVLGADGWAQLQKAGGAEIRGGYLLRLESQGTRLNEVIEGVSYSGQRYEFLFFAQRGGPLTIPEMAIDVEVKTWGADSGTETIRLMTPSLDLSVRQPPGTEQLDGLISTTEFSATQNWAPSLESLNVGDALVREISLIAVDATGMAFNPLIPADIAGISIYLSEPTLADSYNRGSLVGKRREKLTYVFEEPGNYILPDLSYNWWNTSAEKLETITLTGRSVEIQGAVTDQSEGGLEETGEFSFRALLWVIGLAVLLTAAFYRYRAAFMGLFKSWQRALRESETNYFRKVKSAARQGNRELMMRTTLQWLDRLGTEHEPARLDLFLSRYSDASGRKLYAELIDIDHGTADTQLLVNFYDVLATARTRWRTQRKVRKQVEQLLPQVGLSSLNANNTMDLK